MNRIESHISLKKIFELNSDILCLSDSIEIRYEKSAFSIISSINAQYEIIGNNDKIRIDKNSIDISIFSSLNEFRRSKLSHLKKSIFIIEDDIVYSFIEQKTYINFSLSNSNLFTNLFAYNDFINFLKEQEKELDGTFHFIDSYNKDFRKIVLVSISEKSRLTINYPPEFPELDNSKNFGISLKRFKDCFEEKNTSLVRFLKTATINTVNTSNSDNKLKFFFENIDSIVDKARINFEVYLNELSVDKIKSDYDNLKSKYFDGLSEILSKVSQKIIALPISVSALLFAIEKVKDISTYLYILISIIIATSIFISTLLKMHYNDISYIYKIFYSDYKALIENNFFFNYPKEKEMFEEIRNRIDNRVLMLKIIIESFFWLLNISNIILIDLLLNNLNFKKDALILISFFLLTIITFARNNIIDSNKI